ncbi:glycosyltransferase [Treponema sp. OMZ 798]|nr:glycosyltransferase [Treponema sp. OMZ 798]UTC80293.1 glycosyltransferase [Treponema sp. OMZ 798]
MNAEITVVIPTYNKAAYISQTIESVLKQTYQDFEIVIVDDCSQDDTELVVQEYLSDRIRYFKHLRNWGPGATFNDGIEKANTEYVTLIASDDILLPNHLEQVMLQFKKDDLVETVFPKLKVIDENGNDLNEVIEQPFFDKYKMLNHLFYAGNDIPSPGVSFKKSLFKKTAAYNRNLIMMHDYDLNVRCLIHGKIAVVDEPTVYYRRFSNPIINLSGKTKWLDMCLSIESKFVLDNYLSLGYDDMKKIFPHLEACNRKEIKFRFLIDACKNKQVRLSSWAFERLVSCLENNKDFFNTNEFDFQYKDYIDLYKINSKNVIGKNHKEKLYNDVKVLIKKMFGLH